MRWVLTIICVFVGVSLLAGCAENTVQPTTTAGGVLLDTQPTATEGQHPDAEQPPATPTLTNTFAPTAAATAAPTSTVAPTPTPDIAAQTFALTFQNQRYPIAAADIRALALGGVVDQTKVTAYVKKFGDAVSFAPGDATFRYDFVAGRVTWRTKGAYGYSVDMAATVATLTKAFESRAGQDVAATATQHDATYISTNTPQIGGDTIGEWAIRYDDEDAPTRANIELGAQKINGDIVMPGAVFSADRLLYWDGVASYQNSLAITGARTELAPGGGLCLNTTTLFQAAFFAGLPIVQRNPHDYWIGVYAATYKGATYKGLDATVGDLKFRNTTGAPLLVKMWADGAYLHVRFVGTQPNWTTRLSDYQLERAPGAARRGTSARRDVARNPHEGFQSSLTRRVIGANGAVLDTYTVTNNYSPTRKQIMRGTGK